MTSTIGIVGMGFVGRAVYEGMKHAFSIIGVDKYKATVRWEHDASKEQYIPNVYDLDYFLNNLDKNDPIFVCVPSPMKKSGECDIGVVDEVIGLIAARKEHRIVVIKSTVPPGTTELMNKRYSVLSCIFNPEFLREKSSIEDFKNQDRVILGGAVDSMTVVHDIYKKAYPRVPVIETCPTTAEMIKYLTNCFLATKVSFANEIYDICHALGINYDEVVSCATMDSRLGDSHWMVPGWDGERYFGGKCFVKDMNALIFKAKELGVDPKIMQTAWDQCNKFRENRDWEKIPGVIS